MTIELKDPQASVDYSIDWPEAVLRGATIAASEWGVAPDQAGGLTVADEGLAAARTSVRLAGGFAGHAYRVRNRITLSDGRSDERSLTLRVEER